MLTLADTRPPAILGEGTGWESGALGLYDFAGHGTAERVLSDDDE